jgi:hypothetical protein
MIAGENCECGTKDVGRSDYWFETYPGAIPKIDSRSTRDYIRRNDVRSISSSEEDSADIKAALSDAEQVNNNGH